MTQRDRIVLMVVAAVVALGAFWMLALKPKRQEAADLGSKLAKATQRVDGARAELSAGQAARSRYAVNYATVARLGKAVPTDDDVPSLVYQLDSTARSTGVDFRSVKITAGSGAAATPTTSAQAAASTQDNSQQKAASQTGSNAGASSATSGGTQPTTTAAAAAPTQTATAALPPGAVVGPAGLSAMPFSFTFQGSFFRLSDFLTHLERYIRPARKTVDVQGRLLLINGISLTAAASGFPKMTAAISAQAYLLPANQGLFNGATASGPPTAAGQQPVSTTGNSTAAPAAATVAP